MYDNINMPIAGVEWDSEKARLNFQKHRVSFETAQYIFLDSERLWRLDRSENNMSGEDRWQSLGKIGKVLFVVYEEHGEIKRIISARLADKNERRSYNGYYRIDGTGWTEAL